MTEPIYLVEYDTGKRYPCFTDQELRDTVSWLNKRNVNFFKRTAKEQRTMFADRNREIDLSRYLTPDIFQLSAKATAGEMLTAQQTEDISRSVQFLALILSQAEQSEALQDCVRYMRSIQSKDFRHNSDLN